VHHGRQVPLATDLAPRDDTTDTVVASTDGVHGSCFRRFSHRSLRVSTPDAITAIFAKRLKQARAMRGLSQRALGALVDKDQSKDKGSVRINRYEQQVNRADMDSAAALAKALDVPVAYLFAETDDLAELILAYSKLDADQKAALLSSIKRD